jgi:hypothetical protein
MTLASPMIVNPDINLRARRRERGFLGIQNRAEIVPSLAANL